MVAVGAHDDFAFLIVVEGNAILPVDVGFPHLALGTPHQMSLKPWVVGVASQSLDTL